MRTRRSHTFLKRLFLLSLTLLNFFLQGQINAFFSYGVFNTPANQPFLETYFTIEGRSLMAKQVNGAFQNSVKIWLTVLKDTGIVTTNKYNLMGPAFTNTATPPMFIDNQRYSLPNGEYKLRLVVADNFNPALKQYTTTIPVSITFSGAGLETSSIQNIEKYTKTGTQGPLTKSGFDLVPYTVNYYPESSNKLSFYMETYNAAMVLGNDKPFVYIYYLETADNLTRLNNYGGFKKNQAAAVNPLLASIDISKLGTGNYNLVVELRDSVGVRVTKKFYFQRLNRQVDIVALQDLSQKMSVAQYFGRVNNADTLKMFVECLWPISDQLDKERVINQALQKKPDNMKKFIIDFWERRAADTADPVKMWATYYQSVQQAMVLFKCGKQPGYYSERGRVFLQYGPPSQRAQQLNEPNTFPYEIWHYYRANDATNGMFFSNRKFVFVNRNIGDDCYTLVHSDMRGEVNNPRWRFEVTRRNNDGQANPDNENPNGTQYNQFNEIYESPR